MNDYFYTAIGSLLLGSLFLYLSKNAKETSGREMRVGDKQPKDLRKIGLAMIAMSLLFLFVALVESYYGG